MNEIREEGIKEYEEIKEKAGLPSLKEFEEEFEIKVQSPLISGILNLIADRIGQPIAHIEIIFQPGRMADAIESKFHTEEEKTELFKFYKEGLSLIHEIQLASYTNRQKRLEMIKKAYEFYLKKTKPIVQKFLETQVKGWKSKEKVEDYKTYFG